VEGEDGVGESTVMGEGEDRRLRVKVKIDDWE